MNKLNRHENYEDNQAYKNKLARQIALQDYNYVITFTCHREQYTYINDAGKTEIGYVQFEELKSLINECFRRLNYKLLGRRAFRSPEKWIPYLAIPETFSADGRRVQLHCHVYVKSNEALDQYLLAPTFFCMKNGIDRIWLKLASNVRGLSPFLHITRISSQEKAAGYFTKHLWSESAQSMIFTHTDFIGRRRLYDELAF